MPTTEPRTNEQAQAIRVEYRRQAGELDATARRDAGRALELGAQSTQVASMLAAICETIDTELRAAMRAVQQWRLGYTPRLPPILPSYVALVRRCVLFRERLAAMVPDVGDGA